jgi:ABC-type glycerol-3-phosphate transport system permease component
MLGEKKRKLKTKNLLENKKILNILKYIGLALFICLIIYNCLYILNKEFKKREYVKIFNIYISTQKDNLMEPEIYKNSLLISYKTTEKDIDANKIIGYDSINTNANMYIKYSRIQKIKSNNGKITYITKLDKNYHNDIEEKSIEQLKYKIIVKLPIIGFLFRIFESKITTVIVTVFFILILKRKLYKEKMSFKRKQIRK